jgi:hypothetical protein
MEQQYDKEIDTLKRMIEEIRRIRYRTCEPKSNANPRYLGMSSAIGGLKKAIDDMRAEAATSR